MSLSTLNTQQQIIERIQQAKAQRQTFLVQMRDRQKQALEIAQQISNRLKTEFGVQKVVLFGSFELEQDLIAAFAEKSIQSFPNFQ